MDIDNYMIRDIELFNEEYEDEQRHLIDFEDFKDYAYRKEDVTGGIEDILEDFRVHYCNLLSLEDNYVVFIEWLGDLK